MIATATALMMRKWADIGVVADFEGVFWFQVLAFAVDASVGRDVFVGVVVSVSVVVSVDMMLVFSLVFVTAKTTAMVVVSTL